uniref:CSON012490 protein n=1 Tax=Culicoides sonorensis TaxID=179676 RepID=A0A336KWG3_CULSO
MVQGQNYKNTSLNTFEREQPKRAGFESMQKKQNERKDVSKSSISSVKEKSSQSPNKYGAWGPVFQNREHFNSMHFC